MKPGALAAVAALAAIAAVPESKHRGQTYRRRSDLSPAAWLKRKKRNKQARRSRAINRSRVAS